MKKEYDFSRGRRGAVLGAPLGKTRITIRQRTAASSIDTAPFGASLPKSSRRSKPAMVVRVIGASIGVTGVRSA